MLATVSPEAPTATEEEEEVLEEKNSFQNCSFNEMEKEYFHCQFM